MTPEKEYGCGIGRSSGSQNEVFHDNGLAENDWMLGSEWNCEVSNHNLELEPGGLIVSTQSVVSLSGEHKLKQFCDTILHSPVDFSILPVPCSHVSSKLVVQKFIGKVSLPHFEAQILKLGTIKRRREAVEYRETACRKSISESCTTEQISGLADVVQPED